MSVILLTPALRSRKCARREYRQLPPGSWDNTSGGVSASCVSKRINSCNDPFFQKPSGTVDKLQCDKLTCRKRLSAASGVRSLILVFEHTNTSRRRKIDNGPTSSTIVLEH